MTEAHVFHEQASRCPDFFLAQPVSDLSDICLCYRISGHGQRGGKTVNDI